MSGRKSKAARRSKGVESQPSHWEKWKLPGYLLVGVTAIVFLWVVTRPKPTINNSIAGPPVNFVSNNSCSAKNTSAYDSGDAPATNGFPQIGQPVDEMPHDHVQSSAKVTYLHDPPTSGCHYNLGYGQAPVTAGVYNQRLEPEQFVHNLEHGYVIVYYNCPSGCVDDFNKLHAWYKSLPPDPQAGTGYAKVLVIPWTDRKMPTKFAVVSWDWYLPMDTLDISKVRAFYNNHVDQSPESNQSA